VRRALAVRVLTPCPTRRSSDLEWAYMLKGRVRATVFDPAGDWETLDFGPGDVWYFPRGHGHSLQGLGPDEAHFILAFDDGAFSRSEEHTSELQSRGHLVCRLPL